MNDIAVIIVNYKMKDEIRGLLLSLKSDSIGSIVKVQAVIVDNTPEEGMRLMLTKNFPDVKYLPQDNNLGFGKAQNIGLKSVETKYYFILNPDVIFPNGERVLQRLYEFMEARPKIGLCAPKLLNIDSSLQFSCSRFPSFWMPFFRRSFLGKSPRNQAKIKKYLMKDFDHNSTRPVDWLMGSALFARGTALKQVGLFDERYFMYFEDCDLCRRFWNAHWPVYYVYDIKLMHRHIQGSAKVTGFFKSMIKNPLTRIHIISWLKYMWKWRGIST